MLLARAKALATLTRGHIIKAVSVKVFIMLGIIFCGGQSTRMGRDKGLIDDGNGSWAQIAVEKMSSLVIPVKLSVNKNQAAEYEKKFSAADLIKDDPGLSIKGPLLGLLTCHQQFPTEDLFILACDMPLISAEILNELYSIYKHHPERQAYVFKNEEEPEPLCGIYSANGLAHILKMLQQNMLTRFSMKFTLEHLDVHYIPVREDQKKYFQNFNAHSELDGL